MPVSLRTSGGRPPSDRTVRPSAVPSEPVSARGRGGGAAGAARGRLSGRVTSSAGRNGRGGTVSRPQAAAAAFEELIKDFATCVHRPEPRAEVVARVRNAPKERKLDLLGRGLSALPLQFGHHLPNLLSLHCNTNSITALPESISSCRTLEKLIARYNLLRALPAELGECRMLQQLDVSNNQLAELPDSIGRLPLLQLLDVNTNQLVQLPASLNGATALKSLVAHSNQLSSLHDSIGQLSTLTSLDLHSNCLATLPDSIGYLKSLVTLNLSANKLTVLNDSMAALASLQKLHAASNRLTLMCSIAQMQSLRELDVQSNRLQELPTINTDQCALRELSCKDNPLQRPPADVAARGLEAIKRYFDELDRAGAAMSRGARLVLLGDGMAGKTSLQRGLLHCVPSPTTVDARTIQLDITTLTLLRGRPDAEVDLSVWDLGGQVAYAAAQQPYIVPGSLYLLAIPAHRAKDENYSDVLGRWLDYLQAGAPGAVVLPVLTQCDRLLPTGAPNRSVAALEAAASDETKWVRRAIYWHQVRRRKGAAKLQIRSSVVCVCAVEGGGPSLENLLQVLEDILAAKPPLLLSVGQIIPRTWVYAASMLRAMRDGRDPVATARHAATVLDMQQQRRLPSAPPNVTAPVRPYVTYAEARRHWQIDVAPRLRVPPDTRVLFDALQLLINQGELFASCGIIYLHPDYVTSLLKPLVDHRVSREWAIPRAYEHTGDLSEHAPSVQLLLAAVDVLTSSGELREELLPMLWEPSGLHLDDYGEVLLMLSDSGVLFLSEFTPLGRRWVMPMRLPESKPSSVQIAWDAASEGHHLTLSYTLGRIAPPGITERLMASCFGLGVYHQFWRRGALIRAQAVTGAFGASQLLIELLSSSILIDGEEDTFETYQRQYTLVCALRGPLEEYDRLTELLAQVRARAEQLLADFPGLKAEAHVTGAVYTDAPSAPDARAERTRISLALPARSAADQGRTEQRSRFTGLLRFGLPIEAAQGLHRLLGVQPDDIQRYLEGDENSIVHEITSCASPMRDALGWTDLDWLRYVREQPALERPLPAGMASTILDQGHSGKRLDDFVRDATAVAAGLSRAHVLALRLYSGSVHQSINAPLRIGCSPERPHPYPATVAILTEAVNRLRFSAPHHQIDMAESSSNHLGHRRTFPAYTLWRGIGHDMISLDGELLQRGGCELGLLSASPFRAVAERYARAATPGAHAANPVPALLKLNVPDLPQHTGAQCAFLSAFPDEAEFLYPPGTYLRPTAPPSIQVAMSVFTTARTGVPVGLQLTLVRVLEVLPLVQSGCRSQQRALVHRIQGASE